MVRFTQTFEIERPPAEVFAFMEDPDKLGQWQDAVEVEQLTPGPVGQGTRFREVHQVMGRRNEQVTEVLVHEPGKRFDVGIVEGPVPVDGRWDFEPTEGGSTRLTFTASGRLRFPVVVLQPVVVAAMKRSFTRYHARLKQALEAS
jgi:ligand-binding SRPBCC domain-containing protein